MNFLNSVFNSISSWWNRFIQGFVWETFFSRMEWVDWLTVAFLFAGIIYGLRKGFWKVLFDLLRLVFVILMTLEISGWLAFHIKKTAYLPEHWVPVVSFVLTAIASWFLVSFVIRWFRSLFVTKTSAVVRVLGGIALGSLYAFIGLSFLLQILILGPWQNLNYVFHINHSYTGYYVSRAAPEIHEKGIWPVKKIMGQDETKSNAIRTELD